jgi:hypothetical protein
MDLLKEDGKRNISGIKATLTIEFDDEKMAESVLRSVSVDNHRFIQCHRDGRKIICCTRASSPGTALNTIDDLLSCIITAENTYKTI